MLRFLVAAAIRGRGIVAAGCVVLIAYGAWRLSTAGLDIFPEFSPKAVVVQTEAPGMGAEQVERLVTTPLERVLAGLVGLEHVRSESIEGLSIITAVFDEGGDLLRSRAFVAERLANVRSELPTGVVPVMVPLASSSATVRTVGVTASRLDQMALRDLVDTALVPRLMGVPGVADVNVFGGGQRSLQVQFDSSALQRHGLSVRDLESALRGALEPGGGLGFVEGPNQRLSISLAARTANPEDVAALPLRRDLRVGDVAVVAAGSLPAHSAASIAGTPAVLMMIIGQYGANTLTVSNEVGAALDALEPTLAAQGVVLHPRLFVPANYIEASLRNIGEHLLLGGTFVAIVLLLFLFDWRAALVSALAIPLSLMVAVLVLVSFGQNLNIMVLGGLAIALGEVVDDAIIDTENIYRRLREARASGVATSLARIVLQASMEVRGSVVYASFIVALVFVPLLTLSGVAGRLFAPLAVTYILAILASLAVALLVTPALCTLLLAGGAVPAGEPPLISWLRPRYERVVGACCRRPLSVLGASLGLCLLGALLLPGLGSQFLPPLREGHYILHTTALPGTSLAEAIRVGDRITAAVSAVPGVRSMSQWAGRAERGADTYGTHYSEYEIALEPMGGKAQAAVLARIRDTVAGFPGLLFEVNTFLTERVDETISGYAAPVAVNLYGEDLAALDGKAQEIAALMRSEPDATGVVLRAAGTVPQVQIVPDPARLALRGVSPRDVAGAVAAAFAGTTVSQVVAGGRVIPAVLVADPAQRAQVEAIGDLPLRGRDGIVPLREVAAVDQVEGRYNVLHRDGRRLQTISCATRSQDVVGFNARLAARLAAEVQLPLGMQYEITGAALEQAKSRRSLLVDSLLAGVAVLALVSVALGDWRNTLLVLVNLPFALLGGVLAVLLAGGTVSIGSVVGFVTLFGITVRNSIMLLSHYRHLVQDERCAWNVQTAVRGAAERLPSIAMTALVTALAMLPIALDSDNPGREIMGPMAAIIIGGLATSALLNLLVMPSLMLRFGQFKAPQAQQGDAPTGA